MRSQTLSLHPSASNQSAPSPKASLSARIVSRAPARTVADFVALIVNDTEAQTKQTRPDAHELVRELERRLLPEPTFSHAELRCEDSWIGDMYAWNTQTPRDCIVEQFDRGQYRSFDVLPTSAAYQG